VFAPEHRAASEEAPPYEAIVVPSCAFLVPFVSKNIQVASGNDTQIDHRDRVLRLISSSAEFDLPALSFLGDIFWPRLLSV
jgi:hypothetical protein